MGTARVVHVILIAFQVYDLLPTSGRALERVVLNVAEQLFQEPIHKIRFEALALETLKVCPLPSCLCLVVLLRRYPEESGITWVGGSFLIACMEESSIQRHNQECSSASTTRYKSLLTRKTYITDTLKVGG